jgi:hypothetical protein
VERDPVNVNEPSGNLAPKTALLVRLLLESTWMADTLYLVVIHKIASIFMEAGCCFATKHICQKLNQVADLLPFARDITWARGKKKPTSL